MHHDVHADPGRRSAASRYVPGLVLALLASMPVALAAVRADAEAFARLDQDFAGADALAEWALAATGDAGKRMPAPKLSGSDGAARLLLLESWWRSSAAAAAPAPDARPARVVELAFTVAMNTGTEGAGFAWLDTAHHGEVPGVPEPLAPEDSRDPGGNEVVELPPWGWQAPNLRAAFGVGLDARDPVNRDPFRGSGNAYDRPQHLLSLHWDGLEIAKCRTPADFRDEQPHRVTVRLEFVTGGADVTVTLDDELLFERLFVGGMTAYAGRPVFGASNGETAGDVWLDDVSIALFDPIPRPPAPLVLPAFDRVVNDAGHPRNEAVVEFPDDVAAYGRLLAVLRLDRPPTRFDPWDRSAHIWLEDDVPEDDAGDGEGDGNGATIGRTELLRYITPYHRGWEWVVDVSDARPLLTGRRRVVQECSTQGEGWIVSLHFELHEGPPPDGRLARELRTLWAGAPEIGNPEKPSGAFFVPRDVALPDWAVGARLRAVVTGHGMSPNSGNAAEFMPLGRTLTLDGVAHHDVLWKDDNDLNPCRPQGGTWKYDRAGWAPGDVVRAWEVEAALSPGAGRNLRVEYALDDYVNENRGQTWAPFHLTQVQLVLYERAGT
ncbi:MAG: peptide-N-glycosidase F-related protein [Planctomycetota bacterium]|jgi:hypothetical protein